MISTLLQPGFAAGTIVDELTRRRLLGGGIGAAALLVAGCGSDDSSDADAAPGTRTVTDDAGRDVEIPVDPQRTVFLGAYELAAAVVTLGHVPAGVAQGYTDDLQGLLEGFGGTPGDLSGVRQVGTAEGAPNLEAIAALSPDLIVSVDGREENDELAAIAPTVLVNPREADDPYASQRFLADLVGLADVFDERLAEYEERVADLRAEHGATFAELEYALIEIGPDGTAYALDAPYASVRALEDLGARMVPAAEQAVPDDETYAEISAELLPDLDADVMFLATYGGEPVPASVGEVLAGTNAAQADQLVPVAAETWTFTQLQSQLTVLDELESLVTDRQLDVAADFA